MTKGMIWMLHSVAPDSPRTEYCELYRNLTVPPAKLEEFIVGARARGYRFVTMAELLKDKADAEPHKDIVITIDDGFRNIYTEAFPLFRRLNVPFVFFIATGLIERGFRDCSRAQLDGMAILCDQAIKRGVSFEKLFSRYRHWKSTFKFIDGRTLMRFLFGKDIDFARYFREEVCSPDELREMAASGLCEIASHTASHVHMDRTRHIEAELTVSKAKLEQWTGKPCVGFSYPYGHVNAASLAAVKRHFAWAARDLKDPPLEVTESSDDHLLPRVICKRESELSTLLGL